MKHPIAAATVIAASCYAAPQAFALDQPIVVELFTSQSCSSCPPADALLNELSERRPDLLPLDLHVTYWDRLGWKDLYSLPAATERQRHYASRFGADGVYTPQIVINGQRQMVGSDRATVLAAIDAEKAGAATAQVPVRLRMRGDTLLVEAGPGHGKATLWLIGFDAHHTTAVKGGENGGRSLVESNVVRSISAIAEWRGEALSLSFPQPSGERAAVLLQAADGRILGAAALSAS